MSESIYFLNDEQELLKVCGESKIIESVQSKEITADKSELMNDTLSVSVLDDKKIRDAAFMAVRENDDSFSMYKITADSDPRGRLSFTGVNFAVDELHSFIVLDMRPSNRSIKQVAEQILGYTNSEWRVGYVDPTLPAISGTFYYLSVKDALKQLQTFGCEIVFKCKIDGNKITDKWIEIYKQIGIFSNKRFVYGSNALEVVRQRDRSQLYTSIIGRGKGEEVGDGYGRRIEFTDIEWKKANGNPLDKPKGQNWLEYPEMTALYGIPMKNGSKRKRETVLILEDIEDPKELLQATYENLVEYSRPLIQFKTSVLGGDSIGNTVTIHRSDKNYHYKTRVFSVKIDRISNKVECGLGDNLNTSSTRQAASVQNSVTNLAETKMTFYDSTEISKWQSDIIRGAHGGAVILMSPSDYPANHPQRGESRQPFQMVWMDGDSIQTSSHFLVANSDGIGFIDGDFYTSPFKTAWTIDGKFNADFIQTGTILADIFETSFNKLGDTLKLISGALQVENDGLKIMELTKRGMEFWSGSKSIGTIGTAGEPFPDLVDQDGPVSMDGKALIVRTDGDGDYIALSAKTGTGMILGNGKGMYLIDPNIRMIGDVVINGNVDIRNGELRIDGQKVVPGQGGGPSPGGGTGTGGYPPELTTDAEKYAWDWWSFALNNGYSEEAAAGVLGNIQGEVGSSMNPNTAQVGGPAFGWVQWDGSAYPLVGSPTWDGREYVQRLMAAAGIREDYTTSLAQAKLIEWSMYNGQWIGQVSPTTVAGFKAITSVEQAATAFELNFERPAAAHPERQGYARNWYNKLHGLQASQLVGEEGLAHLETLIGRWIGNGQCYAVPAEYSGFLGGCGLGAGTKYGLTHVIGNTSAAADIGIAYDWAAVGWQVILNPTYEQLVVGSIVNITRGAYWGGWFTDTTYGHTGVIRGLENGRIQTYEQNTEKGQIVERFDREYRGGNQISSIVIPPK
ncbi:phage tail spike protein [Enterococcus innesii]|uniref:phage tail spike protein n=1 Tax=Enterococcus innesii TaxID=2839759 RepID=UPI002DB9ACA6|nr:phage tail spike protein [Enterococcus innesii]MEB5950484.1 phage tail tip lysozyme [Enterococcus innesii]